MSDVALASLISTVLATAATLLTAWWRSRGHPTRTIVNAKYLLDSTGAVILNLNEEIARLEGEVEDARLQARDASRQAENCALEVRRLHNFLRSQGIDPEALSGPNKQT